MAKFVKLAGVYNDKRPTTINFINLDHVTEIRPYQAEPEKFTDIVIGSGKDARILSMAGTVEEVFKKFAEAPITEIGG